MSVTWASRVLSSSNALGAATMSKPTFSETSRGWLIIVAGVTSNGLFQLAD